MRRLNTLVLSSGLSVLAACGAAPDSQDYSQDYSREFDANVAGLQAKVLCSETFVAGRDPADVQAAELSSPNLHPAVERVTAEILEETGVKGAQASAGGTTRFAVFRGQYGCSIVPETYDLSALVRGDLHDPALYRQKDAWGAPENTANARHAALQGLAEATLENPNALASGRTRALLIMRNGALLAEAYAPGFGPERPMASYSMGKALTNALVGILVQKEMIDLKAPVPVDAWQGAHDPRREITVEHLLHMSAGLDTEYAGRSDMGSPAMSALFGSLDPEHYALSSRLRQPPGTLSWYSNANTFALMHIVRTRVGGGMADLQRFIMEELFMPLGMQHSMIEFNAYGTPMTTSFNYVSARDWARFGQLYLNDGVVNNRRILPAGWARYTRTPLASSKDRTFGAHWHVNAGRSAGHADPEHQGKNDRPPIKSVPEDALFALGDSGQSLMVVPSMNLIVVRLGQLRPPGEGWNYTAFLDDLMDSLLSQEAGG